MYTCLNAFLTKECDGHTVAATVATVVGPNEGFSLLSSSFSLARPKAPAKHCIAARPGLRLGKVSVSSSLTDLHWCGLGCCGLGFNVTVQVGFPSSYRMRLSYIDIDSYLLANACVSI